MKRTLLNTMSTAALIAGGVPVISGIAWAQDDDRDKKEKRRVLKASDMSTQTLSEEYRRRAREKRHESMDFLKDILANRDPQGTQKAEMMLRLAELYYEEGRDIYFDEMQAFIAEQERCYNTPGCDVSKVQPQNDESEKWSSKAIKLYKMILGSYPQYQRADEATFYLANALTDTGHRDKAVNEYKRLVRTYPESQYVPDAYVQIGEYYFDNNEATKALFAYQAATRYRESTQYSFAMYKLAWCEYNVGEYGKAIDTMKAVVTFSMTASESTDEKKRLTLQEEALKDLVRFFADAGNMDEAYTYFTKLGKKDLIQQMLKRLAAMYFEQGKFEQSIQTYRRLIRENPNSPKAPEYQNEIILSYSKIGRKKETLSEIQQLLEQYGKNSAWARANASDPDSVRAADVYVEKNLRKVAMDNQIDADKLGKGSQASLAYEVAEKAYSVYLQEFPDGKHTYEMRFAYAELLYKLDKWGISYDEFTKVLQSDPNGQHSLFSAESAIYAAQEMIGVEKKEGRGAIKPQQGDLSEIALTEWEERYLAATRLYDQHFSDQDDNRGFIYESAYIYYNHNMLEEADERFQRVIAMNECSGQAVKAANLILDAFTLKGDTAGLKKSSKAYRGQAQAAQSKCNRRGLGSSDFLDTVGGIYENTSFNLVAENFKNNADEKVAADGFWQFYEEFPTSGNADVALNNVAFYAYNTKQVEKSMKARHELIDNFPKSDYYKDNVYYLGYGYESIADFSRAADYYEEFFSLTEDHENSKASIGLAAKFRKASGDYEQAITNYQSFMKAYPTDEKITSLRVGIANIYMDNERWSAAAKAYYDLFTKPPDDLNKDTVFHCRLMYGKALEKQGKNAEQHWRYTLTEYERANKAGEEMTTARHVAAEIGYKQLVPQLEAYMELGISGPGPGRASDAYIDNVLKGQLTKKFTTAEEMEKLLTDIYLVKGGEWSLAALVSLGRVWENFGTSVVESYVPAYLTENQANLYRMGLEDRAYALREKAANYYAKAIDDAFAANLYNEHTAFAIRRLGELRPDDYPLLEEELIDPRYTTRSKMQIRYEERP